MPTFRAFTLALVLGAAAPALVSAQAQQGDSPRAPGAATTERDVDRDNNMDWGWLGLIGLAGLMGLKRRDTHDLHERDRVGMTSR